MQPIRHFPEELIIGYVAVGQKLEASFLPSCLKEKVSSPFDIHTLEVPADRYSVENALRDLTDRLGCDLVLTTGGVGLTMFDVVPEATLALTQKQLPGVAERIRAILGLKNATELFNRSVAALHETPDHTSLIINLPDDAEALEAILGGVNGESGILLPLCDALAILGAPLLTLREDTGATGTPPFNNYSVPEHSPYTPPTQETPQPIFNPEATKAPISANATSPYMGVGLTSTLAKPASTSRVHMSDNGIKRRSVQRGSVPLFPSAGTRQALPSLECLVEEPEGVEPECTIVWLHGLGKGPEDFQGLGKTLRSFNAPPARIIYPRAPEITQTLLGGELAHGWYDMKSQPGTGPEDLAGIKSMYLRISQIISGIVTRGFPAERIFLGGYSQGAAMALYCALRQSRTLAGIIALSGYLPGPELIEKDITPAGKITPFYIAHGSFDQVISPLVAKRSAQLIEKAVDTLIWREYNMDHDICSDELKHIVQFMTTALQS